MRMCKHIRRKQRHQAEASQRIGANPCGFAIRRLRSTCEPTKGSRGRESDGSDIKCTAYLNPNSSKECATYRVSRSVGSYFPMLEMFRRKRQGFLFTSNSCVTCCCGCKCICPWSFRSFAPCPQIRVSRSRLRCRREESCCAVLRCDSEVCSRLYWVSQGTARRLCEFSQFCVVRVVLVVRSKHALRRTTRTPSVAASPSDTAWHRLLGNKGGIW